MSKKYSSGQDFLKDNKKKEPVASEITEQPPVDELAEVHTPDISTDIFKIADKTFKIKISNIKTQKVMAKSLGSINDLMSKLDIKPVMEKFRDKMNDADRKSAEQLKRLEGLDEKELEAEFQKIAMEDPTGNDFYVDLADLIKEIITAGGIDNILIMIMDLITGVVYAICNGQDKEVTMDWIEENINFNQAQEIFFSQMKKDEIQGRVIDFLALAIRLVTERVGSI